MVKLPGGSRAADGSGGGPFYATIAPSAVLTVLAGMFLAFAAAWPAAPAAHGLGRILALHIPGWLEGAFAVALAVASVSLLLHLLPTPRRKDPDEFIMEPPPPPEGGRLVALAIFALLVLVAAVVAWLLSEIERHGSFGMGASHPAPVSPPLRPATPPSAAAQRIGSPAFDVGLDLLVAAVAFGAFAFALWMFGGRRWEFFGFGPRGRRAKLEDTIAAAVGAGVADLEDDADPRQAVIACYRRCESAIATVGRRRYPWQTPREYVHAAATSLRLPPASVASLLRVFERARFSQLPITAKHRDAALAALGGIRAALAEMSTRGTGR